MAEPISQAGRGSIEVEIKLIADRPAVLARLVRRRRIGCLRLGEPVTVEEIDRYLDTADGAVARAAWACRLRTRGGATIVSLKGPPAGTSGGLHRRPEVEGPATDAPDPTAWPASPARDLLRALAGGHPLLERILLRQRRTERAVSDGAERIGILTLDRVRIVAAGRQVGRLWLAELEFAARPPRPELVNLVEGELAGLQGLRPDPSTKLEHALRLAAVRGRL